MHTAPTSLTVPIRVAVVEDDDCFREAFVTAIQTNKDTTVAGIAASRAEGLALLHGPSADVLLVDLGLPDGSGIDVICAAQRAWPRCCVAVTTIFADEDHVMQCIRAGAVGYLLKDNHPQDIVDEIRSMHLGGSPISPQIARHVLQRLRTPLLVAHSLAPEHRAALSARETEVLQLVAKGFTYGEIAHRLGVSRHTVLTFVRRIYVKLEVNSQMEAVNEARRTGLLD